jgi:hypothetical protein
MSEPELSLIQHGIDGMESLDPVGMIQNLVRLAAQGAGVSSHPFIYYEKACFIPGTF